jgi:ribonuclease P protein component
VTEARPGRRPHTLKRRAHFLRGAAARRRYVTQGFILQAAFQPDDIDDRSPRIGFTASRKVGGAVVRNRAKRRLRELARALMPELAIDGIDYVLVARQETAGRDFALLREDFRQALKRIDLKKLDARKMSQA